MNYPYKLIVSNNKIHREFEIREDAERVALGTNSNCEFRLDADDFFSDVRKLRYNKISHGDHFQVRYTENSAIAFEVSFAIDFEVQIPTYNARAVIANKGTVVIRSGKKADLILTSEFCSGASVTLARSGSSYTLTEQESRFGVNVNGSKITQSVDLTDYDFFSISDTFFFIKEGNLYFDNSKVKSGAVPVIDLDTSTFDYPVFIRNTRRKVEPDRTPIKILDPSNKPSKPETNIVTSLLPMILMMVLIVVLRGFMSSSSNSMYLIFSVCTMGLGVVTSVMN